MIIGLSAGVAKECPKHGSRNSTNRKNNKCDVHTDTVKQFATHGSVKVFLVKSHRSNSSIFWGWSLRGVVKKRVFFHFPFFSPRHAQQCYSRVGTRVGGMYGMNNKYSIEHPVTWKAIQGRQGKIVIPPRYFLLFLFPSSSSETFLKQNMYTCMKPFESILS